MLLSIIIPVFNEEKTIAEIINRVQFVKIPKRIKKEIIVIDDASTDETSIVLSKFQITNSKLQIIHHKTNQGKGAAVKTGLSHARGDIILIQDADLEYDPIFIPKLLDPILKGKAKVVYGTRLKNYPLRLAGAKRTPLIAHYIGNKLLSYLTNIIFGSTVTDMETGYKVFRREVVNNIELKSKRFDLEPEITAKILRRGYKIFEVPIKTIPRGYNEGKKITWRDGFVALKTLIKFRFSE